MLSSVYVVIVNLKPWISQAMIFSSYAFALVGYTAAKLRFRGWLRVHVIGQGGSYIAMVTALFVVNWQAVFGEPGRFSFWPWVIPALVGTPLIAFVVRDIMRPAVATPITRGDQ